MAILNFALPSTASQSNHCKNDTSCALLLLAEEASKIDNKSWRDQVYRETAKLMASIGQLQDALSFIDKIETPDTRAMTIRGIGMEAASLELEKGKRDELFNNLRKKAEDISHPPSYAIALTYIAMAQALAGDDDDAWRTAADMENEALRHKAYGETAEIQAERGALQAAMTSISLIESDAFKNKSYSLVSKILANEGKYDDAMQAAMPISNHYKKAKAILYVLDRKRHNTLHQNIKNKEQSID